MNKIKNIKDYLPFYLGCEIKIADNWNPVVLTTENLQKAINYAAKLLLRPLSDMTEEEKKSLKWSADMDLTHTVGAAFNAQEFIYLLSKHFDIFGLIETGLAIDKTTLK